MKIAFDVTSAAFEKKTGTGVYCENLVLAYQKEFLDDQVTHCYRLARRTRGSKFLLPMTKNVKRSTLLDPLNLVSGFKFDIFHGLNTRMPLMVGCKKVATIHDLFAIYGEFAPREFLEDQKRKLWTMLRRSHYFITPAQYTKDIMINELGLTKDKIFVVPEGVRNIFLTPLEKEACRAQLRAKYSLNRPYILSVGTLEKRKNTIGILRTFFKFLEQTKWSVDLVLIGHGGFGFDEISKELSASPMKDRVHLMGFVDDKELPTFFFGAHGFVYLSWEEGFGIPVLEAMACGLPVLTSNTTSLPEVGGGYTWLTSPNDPIEAAMNLKNMLTETDTVREQIRLGQKFALTQTWTRVAQITRNVYTHILSEK